MNRNMIERALLTWSGYKLFETSSHFGILFGATQKEAISSRSFWAYEIGFDSLMGASPVTEQGDSASECVTPGLAGRVWGKKVWMALKLQPIRRRKILRDQQWVRFGPGPCFWAKDLLRRRAGIGTAHIIRTRVLWLRGDVGRTCFKLGSWRGVSAVGDNPIYAESPVVPILFIRSNWRPCGLISIDEIIMIVLASH